MACITYVHPNVQQTDRKRLSQSESGKEKGGKKKEKKTDREERGAVQTYKRGWA